MALNDEQQQILQDIIKYPAPITILQGKAGSGKSFFSKRNDTISWCL